MSTGSTLIDERHVDAKGFKPAWFHTGGQSGATALLYWYPESQVAVALMTNLDGRAITEDLARKIADVAGR
jgi:hypothetical protein